MRIVVKRTPEELAAEAADIVLEELTVPGPANVGLAGGSTPAAAYRLIGKAPIEWDRVTLWLGDERWVPLDDRASNTRMARAELGAAAGARLLAPDVSLGDPEQSARAYETTLASVFASQGDAPGTVVLGLGSDGHTASLFPGTAALGAHDRSYVSNWVPALGAWRLTATVKLLAKARHVLFLVAGADKAPVVAEILDDSIAHPARLVAEGARHVTWLLDDAAASHLKSPPRRPEPPTRS